MDEGIPTRYQKIPTEKKNLKNFISLLSWSTSKKQEKSKNQIKKSNTLFFQGKMLHSKME